MPAAMPLQTLTREARLILLTAGPPANDSQIRDLVRGEIDWRLLSALAVHEKAVPVLWERLRRLADGDIPAATHELLRPLAMVGAFRQAHLEQRFLQLAARIEERRAEALFLKGAALAAAVYGSFTERPMGDLDVLLPAGQARELQGELLGDGWQKAHLLVPGKVSAQRRDAFYGLHHHLPPLVDSRRSGAVVEVHTGLFPPGNPFRFQAEELWKQSRIVSYAGCSIPVPSVPHLLLHLCLHFAWSHLMTTGAWRTFRDVDALAGVDGADWSRFTALATSARGLTSCYWTLRLARSLAGARLPDGLLEELRPPMPEALLSRIERHLSQEVFPSRAACPSEALRRRVWEMAIRPAWSGHGGARPWLASGGKPLSERRREKPRSSMSRAWTTVRKVARWRAYLATLVSAG